MSDGTLLSINRDFDPDITDDIACVRLMLGVDQVKRALEHNEGSLFGYWLAKYRGYLMQVIENENIPEGERHEEAFSLLEGSMEMAKATLIQAGEATASDFDGRGCTFKAYNGDFKRAAEFKVDLLAAGKDGGYMIESRGKMNAASSKAKRAIEDKKAEERAARRKAAGFTPEVVSGNGGPEGKSSEVPPEGGNYLDLSDIDDEIEVAIREVFDKAREFQRRKHGVKEFSTYMKDTVLRKLDTIMNMNCKELLAEVKDAAVSKQARTGTDG